ncbi:MAG: hypothetical protein M0D55_16035 [Elusimicrobiota bacterium]|nr:MAG: hypothetical protein M0D55_16035 [Elusimicrobiota bacterium]
MASKEERMLDYERLIEIARKHLVHVPANAIEAAKFKKVSIRTAVTVILENEEKKTRYEITLNPETGEFLFSNYHSPNTDG